MTADAPRRRGPGKWVQGLACGALVTLATPTAVLAGVLMLPTIISFALDHAPGKPTTRALLLFGVGLSASPMLALWSGGHTMGVCLALLGDPATPAAAWAAQAAGWLLVELFPVAVRVAQDIKTATEMRLLRAERARLEAAWGIAPGAPDDAGDADAG